MNKVKRKRTQFYQPYPLRKTRKTEAKNTQELYDPTLTDSGLGESDNQQIFENNIKDLTKFFLDQERNPASHGLLSETDEHESDNRLQNLVIMIHMIVLLMVIRRLVLNQVMGTQIRAVVQIILVFRKMAHF